MRESYRTLKQIIGVANCIRIAGKDFGRYANCRTRIGKRIQFTKIAVDSYSKQYNRNKIPQKFFHNYQFTIYSECKYNKIFENEKPFKKLNFNKYILKS